MLSLRLLARRLRATTRSPSRTAGMRAAGAPAAITATVLCGLAACRPAPVRPAPGAWAGEPVAPATPRPDFTLTATDGRPFRFREATAGRLTLLFFGYTHCPDVCPVHFANLASVLRRLPPEVASRTRVVFVSTDPARDSLPAIRAWLDQFDARFVGLTGTPAAIAAAERAAGVPAARKEKVVDDTAYTVGHAAAIIAYTADDSARVRYPFGTRQEDWARDLPRLAAIGQ